MRNNPELGRIGTGRADLGQIAPAVAALPLIPLDVAGAVNTVLNAVSTLIVAVMVLGFVVLILGAFGLLIMAGVSFLSEESSRQGKTRDYLKRSIGVLVIALFLLVGPEFLTQVGAPWPEQFNVVSAIENVLGSGE